MDFSTQQLRQQILSLAIQGKLVPQITEEGNAKDLLQKIEAERKKSNSKYKPLPPVTDEEKPFEIPESWCWCRLGMVCNVKGGKRIPAGKKLTKEDTGYKYIRVTDMKNWTVLDTDVHYITKDIYEKIKAYTISTKDVYITVAGTIGQSGTIPDFFNNANLTENADKLEIFDNDKQFIVYMLNSPFIQKQIKDSTTKVGQPKLAIKRIEDLVVALPPLAEQKRIVAKLEELLGELDTIEQTKKQIEHYAEQLQGQILQTAIQGKLVPQIASEGNAQDILHKIEAERKKSNPKYKPLPPVTDEEKPFEIPESWEWCRISDIFQIINGDRGKNYPSKSTLSKEGIPFISALNLKSNTVVKDDDLLCLTDSQYEKLGNGKLQKNDMVVCIRGSLGKHGIYPFEKGAIASSLVIVRLHLANKIISDFLNFYLESPLFFQEISKYDNGTAQPNLAADSFKKFLFPLPPLSEQKRIVAKLEELLGEVEKFKR